MSKPNFMNKKLKPSEILAKTLFRINVIPAFGRGSYQKNKKLLKDYGKQQIQEQEFLNAIDENICDDVQLSKTHDERKELRKQKLNSIIEAANTFKLRRERAKELDDQIAVLKKEKAKLLSDIPVIAEKMMRYHQINKKDTYGGEFVSTGDEQAREACKDFKEFLEMNTDTEQTK